MTIGTSPALRERNLGRLPEGVFDVLIVGGGINGAVSAASLAARGASVALIDRGDFACLTSQESSNLVWGGIKYLENYEFRLVRKLCRSRNELIRNYPMNVREIRFFAPIEKRPQGFKRMLPVLFCGTWLYYFMGGRFTRSPRWLTRACIERDEPAVNVSVMRGGIEYSDAYLLDNDARFVFGFIRTALSRGAAAVNYAESRGSTRDADGLWTTVVLDRVSGRELSVRSRTILNTAGPHVDGLNEKNGVTTGARHLFSKGVHLVTRRLASRNHVLTFFDDTNRMFFVIPMGPCSVIGTTDTPMETPECSVTDEDRSFLLDSINRRMSLEAPLTHDDIISERCGVRPLAVERQGNTGPTEWIALSRKHIVDVNRDLKHVSVFGGKLTDCLNVGEEIADAVEELGIPLPKRDARWYGEPEASVRADYDAEARLAGIDDLPSMNAHERLSERLWRRYGASAFGMLEKIARDPRQADPVSQGAEYRWCEAEHAANSEMVVTLEDFLRRRSKLALIARKANLERSRGLREGCRALFGDDAQARFDEYFSAH